MIQGGNPALSRQKDIVEFYGSFIGQGAVNGVLVPTTRADGGGVLCKKVTLTRTAAGRYTLAHSDGSIPNIIQASAQIRSTNAAPVQIVCQPLVYNNAAGTVTFIFYNPSTLAAADPTATEFVETMLVASNAGQP